MGGHGRRTVGNGPSGDHLARATSERKAAEEERYRTLFDFANDAIMVNEPGGKYLEVNRTACESLGYSREELLTMSPADINPAEFSALIPARNAMLIRKGSAFFETVHLTRDGTPIPVELSSKVIHIGDRKAILSIARDITERKAAEGERARLATAIEKAANQAVLEERDRLSRELHDGLAQDLWLAKLKAGGLKAVASMGPEAAQILDELNNAIDFALADTRRAVKALRSGRSGVRLSMSELLRDDIEDFSDRFGLLVELACEREIPDLPPRSEAEILRIAHEALTNVRKHADATLVRVRADVVDGFLAVTIHDNGRGFVPRHAPAGRVGLASMRERAALLGGKLTIDSRPSGGTTITLRVPLQNGRPKGKVVRP